jgi:hypothetical protein
MGEVRRIHGPQLLDTWLLCPMLPLGIANPTIILDPIMWAANPAWWLAFGVCAVNAAYQRRIQSIRDGLLLVGGWLALLVGIKLAQR